MPVFKSDAPADARSDALYETLRERLLANAALTARQKPPLHARRFRRKATSSSPQLLEPAHRSGSGMHWLDFSLGWAMPTSQTLRTVALSERKQERFLGAASGREELPCRWRSLSKSWLYTLLSSIGSLRSDFSFCPNLMTNE
ncbi:hypothetical protein [Nostoc sp.]|uniref:hypothetical protein n=1 Tax=Nostoc sp. TaxID=1180 RepID=UPI002FFB3666